MKNHFIKLFNYDHFANNALLNVIIDANNPRRPIQLMAHLLVAERRWLDRVNEVPPYSSNELWPTDFTAEHCAKLITEYHEEWIGFLERMPEAGFSRIISYQNSMGDSYSTAISDILTHVINHSTHTRAQAGQQLKLTGTETLPITDYVYYLRQLNS
jgi:uncharacterized damage-inducible protein DinB